jgi:mono/diheme cytochrome c family protein
MPSNRTRLILKTVAATLAGAALLASVAGFAVLKSGRYNIGATAQHFQVVHTVLEQGMHESVRHHARDVAQPPALASAQRIGRGAALYRDNCAQCHGAPGVAPLDLGKGMQPVPGPLVDAARRWKPRELYWITRHGIKMSGMPAWEARLSEADTWAVVAFLARMPGLDVRAYRELTAARPAPAQGNAQPAAVAVTGGDAARGKRILAQYACQSCHRIPGVTGSKVDVGRPLDGLAKRRLIAGTLPNGQANLVRWIRNPQAIDPETAMPDMGVSERDALDISAYLLRR